VDWATDALDESGDRRERRPRRRHPWQGRPRDRDHPSTQRARYALGKNPENLTDRQAEKLNAAAASRRSSTSPERASSIGGTGAAFDHDLSNALVESTDTKIRADWVAFGFRSPEALIALAMLSLGGYRPVLPGRRPVTA
jgi:hypothetical protein